MLTNFYVRLKSKLRSVRVYLASLWILQKTGLELLDGKPFEEISTRLLLGPLLVGPSRAESWERCTGLPMQISQMQFPNPNLEMTEDLKRLQELMSNSMGIPTELIIQFNHEREIRWHQWRPTSTAAKSD